MIKRRKTLRHVGGSCHRYLSILLHMPFLRMYTSNRAHEDPSGHTSRPKAMPIPSIAEHDSNPNQTSSYENNPLSRSHPQSHPPYALPSSVNMQPTPFSGSVTENHTTHTRTVCYKTYQYTSSPEQQSPERVHTVTFSNL